jgi:DNA-binding CsgD family transcriptional regulator
VPVLTARQLGALRLVSHGHTLREIAERMGVGVATVRDYVDGARRKLKARDGHHAAFLALRLHLIA